MKRKLLFIFLFLFSIRGFAQTDSVSSKFWSYGADAFINKEDYYWGYFFIEPHISYHCKNHTLRAGVTLFSKPFDKNAHWEKFDKPILSGASFTYCYYPYGCFKKVDLLVQYDFIYNKTWYGYTDYFGGFNKYQDIDYGNYLSLGFSCNFSSRFNLNTSVGYGINYGIQRHFIEDGNKYDHKWESWRVLWRAGLEYNIMNEYLSKIKITDQNSTEASTELAKHERYWSIGIDGLYKPIHSYGNFSSEKFLTPHVAYNYGNYFLSAGLLFSADGIDNVSRRSIKTLSGYLLSGRYYFFGKVNSLNGFAEYDFSYNSFDDSGEGYWVSLNQSVFYKNKVTYLSHSLLLGINHNISSKVNLNISYGYGITFETNQWILGGVKNEELKNDYGSEIIKLGLNYNIFRKQSAIH